MTALCAALTLAVLSYGLNGNIRYQVGVGRVSGYSVAETFSHRPITFRLLSAAQAWLPELASQFAGSPGSWWRVWAFETGFRLVAAGMAAGAATLLGFGLRRVWGNHAWPYGVAAYAALMFTAPATGEPDWMAALLSVAAVGAGLLWRPILGGSIGGALLALAALVKISTLPVAMAALVILWMLDRRRGSIALVAATAAGLAVIATVWWLAPYEIGWLLDIRALQPDPWTRTAAVEAVDYVMNLAARWPAVALLPAFFVGARRGEAVTAAVGLALTGLAFVYQGQYFVYHSMGFVVLSAVLAVRTLQRSTAALRWPVVGLSVWTLVLFVLPAQWRLAHPVRFYVVTGVWMVGLAAWQWVALHGRQQGGAKARTDWWAALLVVLVMVVTQTPFSAESLTMGTAGRTVWASGAALQAELASAEGVHALIGRDTQVAYLTFGDATYVLGNPTHCRYPSQLFLQRPHADQRVSAATRQEALACLADPAARWLIWDRDWLHRKGAPADLIAAIDQTWACDTAQGIGGYTLCPRKR